MTHFRLSFAFFFCLVFYGGATLLQAQNVPEGGTVEGRIIDTTLLERPINGVRVVFSRIDGPGFETKSDAKGEYKQTGLPPGRYSVNLYKPEYEDRIGIGKFVAVVEGGRHYVPLTMNKAENTNNIISFLRNFVGYKRGGMLRFWIHSRAKPVGPISDIGDVEIKIVGSGSNAPVYTGVSDENGQYRSEKLPPGNYMVTVHKNDSHVVFPMTIYEDRITDARVGLSILDRNIDSDVHPVQRSAPLKTKNILRGQIRKIGYSGSTLVDVGVVIKGVDGIVFSGGTNPDAEYKCIDLPAGRYLINLGKKGFKDRKGIPVIVTYDENYTVTVIEERMFVSYAIVADGNLFELTLGMRYE